MNRAHWKELLPVITAFANGDEIEHYHEIGCWRKIGNPDFTDPPSTYRIAPKPRKVWIIEYDDGAVRANETKDGLKVYTDTGRIAEYEIELPPLT